MTDDNKADSRIRFGLGAGLALLGLLERLLLWLNYAPIEFADTRSYLRLASQLADGALAGFDGTRAPGYPVFLALLNMQAERIWIAQLALGLGISLLLFWIVLRMTDNPILAFAAGLLYDLIPGIFLFESNLLTETLSMFLIVLSYALLLSLRHQRRLGSGMTIAILAGVVVSLAGLVRPLFFLLSVWMLPFIWLLGSGGWKQRLLQSAAYCLPPLLLLGGWLFYMQQTFHVISPTAMGGYHMVQHTGVFFELLPDEQAPIRDTYLKYRQEHIEERGTQANTIWDAIPELQQVTGLNFYSLSREMEDLSRQLIWEHPDLYMRNVFKGWVDFWKAPVYWQPEKIDWQGLRVVLKGLAIAGRALSLFGNALFLLLSAGVLVLPRLRRKLGITAAWWAIAGFIWLSSVAQTLVDHGDNPRFLIPVQMLVLLCVIIPSFHWAQARQKEPQG